MRILILNWKDITHPSVGGAEIIAFNFAKKLAKDGNEVTFFCSSYKGSLPNERIDGVDIIRRGSLYTVYLQAFLYFIKLKNKPDLIIEMINTICWQSWIYASKVKRVSYLNQLAKEVWFYEFSKPFSYFGYIFERLEYLPYRNTNFICYSKSTKEDLISYGINRKKIGLFSLGIDHDRYRPGSKSKNPLFIFVARFVKMKRPHICVSAMTLVLKKHPSAKLILVGNGNQEKDLKDQIEILGISKSVEIVNKNNFYIKKSNKDIKIRLMQEAWALLLPSVKEGWGMVVTEAAASGTISIVTDVSGLRDSTNNGKAGLIIPSNVRSNDLANAMIQIIDNNKLRLNLEKEALSWSKNFSWERSYREFANLL